MQRKSLVAGNKNFLNNASIIYLLIFLFVFSIVANSFIFETISADSNSYYISTDGDNGNNGLSPQTAWATLQYAMTKVGPGDTVYIMAGVYYNTMVETYNANMGTASNWITYTNYNDGEVILDATGGNYEWGGAIRLVGNSGARYLRFSHLTFRNCCNNGILISSAEGPTHDITIDNCTIYNCSESGIYAGGVENIIIENNTIYDCQNGWHNKGVPSNECITLLNVNNFIIRNNIMYDNHKICIDAKSGSHNGVICGNKIDTTSWWSTRFGVQGIYVDAQNSNCNNIIIYNNIIWGNQTGFEFGTELGGTLNDIIVYNNIYYGTQNAFQINDHTSEDGSHLKTNLMFINNVVSNAHYCFQITDKNTNFKNLTIRNNILEGNRGFNLPGDLKLRYHNVDHNLYNVLSSAYYGSYSINGSPCFVDPDHGNFNLLSNSPAIDVGSSVDAPSVDFNGVMRPQGAGFDIGAFEFISSYDDLTPPQISDISIVTSNPLDTDDNYGWEDVSCYVTDNIEVDNVYITIIRPNNNKINIKMTKISNSNYYHYNSSWSNYGNYSYYIRATDTSGNTKYSDSYSFSLAPNWDINSDGCCNILDLILVSNHYNEIGANGWIREDVDNNGKINMFDMTLISNHYNENWYT